MGGLVKKQLPTPKSKRGQEKFSGALLPEQKAVGNLTDGQLKLYVKL